MWSLRRQLGPILVRQGNLTDAGVELTVNSFDRHRRILQHHGFFDFAGVNREGKWRDRRQLAQLPVEVLHAVEKSIGFFGIQKNLTSLAVCFLQQWMIRLVRLEHTKNRFRAPMHLSAGALLTWVIARHHQSGLSDAAELPLYQFGSAQSQAQIFSRAFALETDPPIFQRQFLEPANREQESRVVERDECVTATSILHPPGDDAGKRVV